jgi:hypothetical protein
MRLIHDAAEMLPDLERPLLLGRIEQSPRQFEVDVNDGATGAFTGLTDSAGFPRALGTNNEEETVIERRRMVKFLDYGVCEMRGHDRSPLVRFRTCR